MKAMVIYNPAAGQHNVQDDLKRALGVLQEAGWVVVERQTLNPGDATHFAQEAVQAGDIHVVLTVGGDGTLNEAVQALAHQPVALGVLPVGTGNVWARQLGLPLNNLPAAAAAILRAGWRTVDLGRANDRYFLLWAGVGFDAQVAQAVEYEDREIKRHLGPPTYLISGTRVAWTYRGHRVRLILEGRSLRRRMIWVVAANTRLYGAFFQPSPTARLDDGYLDVTLFKGKGLLTLLRHWLLLLLRRHLQDPEVEHWRVTELTVRSGRPFPLQTDGEPIGTTPVTIRVVPRAARVVWPTSAPQALLSAVSSIEV